MFPLWNEGNSLQHQSLLEYNLDLVNVIIYYVLLYDFFLWLMDFSST